MADAAFIEKTTRTEYSSYRQIKVQAGTARAFSITSVTSLVPNHRPLGRQDPQVSPQQKHFSAERWTIRWTVHDELANGAGLRTTSHVTDLQPLASIPGLPPPQKPSNRPKCRYFLSPKGCRAGSDCHFVHDSSKLEGIQAPANSGKAFHSTGNPDVTPSERVGGQSSEVGSNRITQGQQNVRRYEPPPVDASRIVQKPIPRLQKESPRQFQLRQLERRFSTQQIAGDGESKLEFRLVPSDPDFPFELTGLECVLHVPNTWPGEGRPSLAVRNHDMPRGYQINVERGFDALAQNSTQATLLSLINVLDRQLETLLAQEKAESIELVPNTSRSHPQQQQEDARESTLALAEIRSVEKPREEQRQFTPEQRHAAEVRRQTETRQLEARLGRLPSFSRSSDGTAFNVPISPRKPGDLPVPLHTVQSVKLHVPLLYPLQACGMEIPGVSRELADKVERAFAIRAKDHAEMSLMAHINYLSQNLHTMTIEAEQDVTTPELREHSIDKPSLQEEEDPTSRTSTEDADRSHIKIIPRPPEWTTAGEEESDSDSDFSDSHDSGEELEDDQHDGHATHSAKEASTIQTAERGISLSFTSLELHHIELLELASLSLSIKCTRCKTSSDIPNLRPSTPRPASCPKCAQPFSLNFRPEPMHVNSFRAGYLDLTGCTITDMLPSTFIPTCSTCSTPVPTPGVVSVRGSADSIAICRECHSRLTFKIPETKFMLVSNTSLHPRNLLPLRRRKQPKENLGIVAGQELPRRGR
ncbi:MAG: hypothetical protein Q9201_001395, partial [Fulgogasparrea decipioides]